MVGFVCECGCDVRSACEGEPFYAQHNGKRYCVLHFPNDAKADAFKKAIEIRLSRKNFNFRGAWFPSADFSNVAFEATTNFANAYFNGPANFSEADFNEEADFRGSTFSSVATFSGATFKKRVRFDKAAPTDGLYFRRYWKRRGAIFRNGANFRKVSFIAESNFRSAEFGGEAYFFKATFHQHADFRNAKFKTADFGSTTFREQAGFSYTSFEAAVHFNYAKFAGEAYFSAANFGAQANFSHVEFGGNIKSDQQRLAKSGSLLDLQYAKIERPARFYFHTVKLRPHWFINVDSDKFNLIAVEWEGSFEGEVEALKSRRLASPHILLAKAYRQIALNAEENHRYEEASKFRYWAMELQRQEMDPIWKEEWYEFAFWRLDWWYWATSGYGERVVRAFLMLSGIWVVFTLLYTQVGFTKPEWNTPTPTAVIAAEPDTIGEPLSLKRAWTYSLAVMSLQKPEPKPLTGTAQTLVLLETILGPVQAALLALAIRRKFMR